MVNVFRDKACVRHCPLRQIIDTRVNISRDPSKDIVLPTNQLGIGHRLTWLASSAGWLGTWSTWLGWVGLVEIINEIRGIGEVLNGLPSGVIGTVALPENFVLELAATGTTVQDTLWSVFTLLSTSWALLRTFDGLG